MPLTLRWSTYFLCVCRKKLIKAKDFFRIICTGGGGGLAVAPWAAERLIKKSRGIKKTFFAQDVVLIEHRLTQLAKEIERELSARNMPL